MSAPLSKEQLAEIAARAEAATPGPWCTDSWEIYQGAEYVAGAMWIGETCRGGTTTLEQDRADAAFVAAAREDVPALLTEVERLRDLLHDVQRIARNSMAEAKGRKAHGERLEARVTALESERHTTNEALSKAVERVAEMESAQTTARTEALNEAAEEADRAGGLYAQRGDNDRAGAAFALMERLKAMASPCSFPPCDTDGTGEPCDRHEREQSHADGEHELCEPECVGGAS